MPDTRFKDPGGYCKLCHKLCYDSEEEANEIIATAPDRLSLIQSYECPFYPSGYWHVTSSNRPHKKVSYRVALARLGPHREEKLIQRIVRILNL